MVSVLTVSILIVPSAAWGQPYSYTWNGGGSDDNWTTGANWGGSGPSSSPYGYLNFAGSTQLTSNNNFANYSSGYQIYFNAGAGAYTLTGNAINFYDYSGNNPLIENDSSNLQTVEFQVDAEHNMNFIANTGNLLFTGSGIYIDSSSNLNFTATSGRTITISDTINNATNGINIGGTIGSYIGGGTVIFAGTNTYTGATTINGGTLQLGNGGATGSIASGNTIYFNVGSGTSASSGTLAINLTGSPTISNNIVMNSANDWANIAVASGQTATLSGSITGAGEVWTTGAGTLVITPNAGSAGHTANNVISTGTLQVSDFSTSTLGTGNFFIVNGALNYTGSSTSTTRLGNFALQSSSSTIGVTTSGTTLTLSNDLGGFAGGGLTKTGSGALALSVANTYTGGTTVTAGTLYVQNTSNSGTGTDGVKVNGGTLAGNGKIAPTTHTFATGVVVAGGNLASGNLTAISGTANTTSTGSGTGMKLDNTAALSSILAVNGGSLTFALGTNTTGGSGYNTFGTPSLNSTYMTVTGNTTGEISFTGIDTVNLVDLTTAGVSAGTLALRTSTPYLLIQAGSDSDYAGLITVNFTGPTPVYSIDGNGYVVGVLTSSYAGGNTAPVLGTDYTAITINQYGSDGVATLTPGTTGYYDPKLYLNAGDLEVVPEPSTWALTIGGLAMLVFIQRRKGSKNA